VTENVPTGNPPEGTASPRLALLLAMAMFVLVVDSQLEPLLADEPEDVQAEILRINKEARDRSLRVALLVPVLASLLGLLNAFRMRRLPDPTPASIEDVALG
jgi:hypothetical protein